MGTRSITHVFDEQGRTVVTIYRHWDGHPAGQGADIKDALTEHKWNDEYCAAALLVWALKAGEAGNIYLVPPGTSGMDEEFTYRVTVDEENTVLLTVVAGAEDDVPLYDGPLADFKPEECRMMEEHLHRSWIIDCCADGTLTCRRRGQWPFNGAALPVFSADTEEEARELIVLVAKLLPWRHPLLPRKEPWYRLEWFSGNVEALPQVTRLLAGVYRGMCERGEVE